MCKGQLGILHMLKDYEMNDLYKAETYLDECRNKILKNSAGNESPSLRKPRMSSNSPIRSPKKLKSSKKAP